MNLNRLFIVLLISFSSCTYKSIEVDLIIHNAKIYTVDETFSTAEAMAIKDGKIVELGAERAILNKYSAAKELDLLTKSVYPGFIDAHCHFLGYGLNKEKVMLYGTESWDEVIEELKAFTENRSPEVIFGEGWDQNDWEVKEFPNNELLNELYPNTPVLLDRVDGHAIIANKVALDLAGIMAGKEIEGGIFEVLDGKLTGLLIDNAKGFILDFFPMESEEKKRVALLNAQKDCFQVGLTTIDDAGLDRDEIELIQKLQDQGELKMRIYGMISDNKNNLEHYFKEGPIKTDRLNIRSVKVYADGALGSRGAALLAPYEDAKDQWGFLLSSFDHFDSLAAYCFDNGFQMNTHCIGDSANRYIADLYGKYLSGSNDKRWRIEHAQVLNEHDFTKYGKYSIIPSVQPTHATSDMYWAEDRIGAHRLHGAYAYQDLLKQNGLLALGTDFPVESINPLWTFYAAVSRKDKKGYPEGAFLPEQKLSRKEALRGMTIWAALANFEEMEKGSLESGKLADFVVLESDIMAIDEDELFDVKVLYTYINGIEVFKK